MKTTTTLFLLVAIAGPATAQIPSEERAALIALYNATDGANWNDNSGWQLATLDTECTWTGITCAGGHVSET